MAQNLPEIGRLPNLGVKLDKNVYKNREPPYLIERDGISVLDFNEGLYFLHFNTLTPLPSYTYDTALFNLTIILKGDFAFMNFILSLSKQWNLGSFAIACTSVSIIASGVPSVRQVSN